MGGAAVFATPVTKQMAHARLEMSCRGRAGDEENKAANRWPDAETRGSQSCAWGARRRRGRPGVAQRGQGARTRRDTEGQGRPGGRATRRQGGGQGAEEKNEGQGAPEEETRQTGKREDRRGERALPYKT